MKLISKYTDFYDYLIGIYGEDEKLVYDRRIHKPVRLKDISLPDTSPATIFFAINGNLLRLEYFSGKFYYTAEELVDLRIDYDKYLKEASTRRRSYLFGGAGFKNLKSANAFLQDPKNTKTNINYQLRQPVLVGFRGLTFGDHVGTADKISWCVPVLSDFPITRYLTAEDVYKDISEFLGWLNDNPEIPNTQTNEEKIVTHGFDLKNSFRHRK